MMGHSPPRLILLDRDGVLNEDRADYVKSPAELVMVPGAAEAVAQMNRSGAKVCLVTNQSAVGRGIISQDMVERIHARLFENLRRAGAHIDLIRTCFDAPWAATERRKPGPGMIREALAHFRLAPCDAFLIGDQITDLQAAQAAGVSRGLVRTGKGAETQSKGLPHGLLPVSIYDTLMDAAQSLFKNGEAGAQSGSDACAKLRNAKE
jgi:D-glycero-D-manno-heptose 1,7-bisphosphate phosphatase